MGADWGGWGQKRGSTCVPSGKNCSLAHCREVGVLGVGAEEASERRGFHRGTWKMVGFPGGQKMTEVAVLGKKLILCRVSVGGKDRNQKRSW